MSGLIWAGIGKGISDAGASLGAGLMRNAEREEDREHRAAQARDLQRERLEARAAADEANRVLRRELAANRNSGGNSGPSGLGLAMTDERAEAEAAAAGMTLPEYNTYWNAIRSGNRDGLQLTQRVVARDDEYGPQLVESTGSMSDEQFRAKAQTLARIRERFTFGKDYDSMSKGQNADFARDVGQGIIAGTLPRGSGVAVAAMEGKPVFGGNSDVTRDLYSGATGVTPVGQSVIRENNAQAGKASVDASATRAETAITNAQRALADAIDKATKRIPPISAIDALDPAKVAEHAAKVQRTIDENPDIKQMRDRLARLYNPGGARERPAPRPGPAAAGAASGNDPLGLRPKATPSAGR
jgi:hypothetical protein